MTKDGGVRVCSVRSGGRQTQKVLSSAANAVRRRLPCAPDAGPSCPRASFAFACGNQSGEPSAKTAEEPEATALDKAIERVMPGEFTERLLATRGQIQAERRPVTIHCSDFKGSTAMAEESGCAPAGQWRCQHVKTNDQERMCDPLCAPGLRSYGGGGACPEHEVGLSGDGTACSGPGDESREK
jgi:hypothetical protein